MCTQGNQAGHVLQHTYCWLMIRLVWLAALSTTTRINCFTLLAHHWELVVHRAEKTVFVCSLLAPTSAIPGGVWKARTGWQSLLCHSYLRAILCKALLVQFNTIIHLHKECKLEPWFWTLELKCNRVFCTDQQLLSQLFSTSHWFDILKLKWCSSHVVNYLVQQSL